MAVLDSTPPATHDKRYLFGPVVDFLGLGGLGLIVLGLFMLSGPQPWGVDWAITAAAIAHVINHPHFAASYQIFYGGFRRKLTSPAYPLALRLRYGFAGLVVPIAMGAWFAGAFLTNNEYALGYGANAMFFLVGWHYVKQGYGALMVDATLKRAFFGSWPKVLLQGNAYACWMYAYLQSNAWAYESQYWGIRWASFAAPEFLLTGSLWLMATTSVAALAVVLWHAYQTRGAFPLNGTIGYISAIYPWTVVANLNPAMALLIPAFHSLQYMTIVARYRINRYAPDSAEAGESATAWLRRQRGNGVFLLFSLALGYLGFWGAPGFIAQYTTLDGHFGDGKAAIFFSAWIFINVHHYFLDNVMWRRENPEMKQYLFRTP